MALERYRELSREIHEQAPGFKTGLQIVDDLVASLQKRGLLPKSGDFLKVKPELTPKPEAEKVYPEIPLDEEFVRQQGKLIRIALKLGMSEQDTLADLPKRFPDRLPEYDELDINTPLIVPKFVGFSWRRVVEAANLSISDYLKDRLIELADWQDPRKVEILDKPYAAWFHTGDRYKYRKPVDVRGELHRVEVAGDHWGGAGLSILKPDIVRIRWFDLIGGQVGSDYVPCVFWWHGRPRFNARFDDFAFPRSRVLVRGSKFEA